MIFIILSRLLMNDIKKRFLLFLIGCMGTRLLFVYAAKNAGPIYLPYIGYLALIPAIGFTYIFLTGSRPTGGETFGQKIWWNNLRPVHAMLYIIFAYKAINKNADAWKILLLDVAIGLVSFLTHHYQAGNFQKLI
jgi:hypothetical protein